MNILVYFYYSSIHVIVRNDRGNEKSIWSYINRLQFTHCTELKKKKKTMRTRVNSPSELLNYWL